ncbi:MAG: hypothetical protein IJQ82_06455 [Selenomonadaceae bacterium]|nr:hypothetical protein [Selenomonadaceae bacterium]
MTKVISLVISSTTSSAKKQTNIVSYINPAATNEQIRTFAQKIIALTTDTYNGVTKVTKESVI